MPDKKAEYRLSPKAREDMEAVWLYSLAQWGADQTERYVDELTEAFQFLAHNAEAGAACENIRVGYRKYPIMRHVVYYRKAKYGIEIMRILHDRMLASRHY
jgi:toxin ParE1/3/4